LIPCCGDRTGAYLVFFPHGGILLFGNQLAKNADPFIALFCSSHLPIIRKRRVKSKPALKFKPGIGLLTCLAEISERKCRAAGAMYMPAGPELISPQSDSSA
jgi:hypothetical protein